MNLPPAVGLFFQYVHKVVAARHYAISPTAAAGEAAIEAGVIIPQNSKIRATTPGGGPPGKGLGV